MSRRDVYDAVVVGGGPAGAAAALTLARGGARVLLAEALAGPPAFKVGESLPPAARPLLRDLGVEGVPTAGGHAPSPGNVSVWGGDEPVANDFIRDLHGPGWHLDRPRFDADLRAAARAAGAALRTGCALVAHERAGTGGGWRLRLRSRGATVAVSAAWLLDATGRRALVAAGPGGTAPGADRLVARCVSLAAAEDGADNDARTWIEAGPEGWWHSARLPGGRRVVTFFTDADLPAAMHTVTAAGFRARLVATRHLCAYAVRVTGRIRRFPAGGVARERFGGEGWLALGDASLAFDPLSSQGMFHALYTGLRGAQAVLAAPGERMRPGDEWEERLRSIRAAYERHRGECYAAETRWRDEPFWRRRQI